MFNIQQIRIAHAKVKSGADFPKYVQELISLGVSHYNTFVSDGHTNYYGKDGFMVSAEAKYDTIPVADASDTVQFRHYLSQHQQGQTTYPEFCHHAAITGVEKWTVDMNEMTCAYYNKEGNSMLVEEIPVPGRII